MPADAPKPAKKALAKASASKAAKNAATKAAKTSAPPAPKTPKTPVDPFGVVFHPVVTEKTMFNMDKNNSLEFLVRTTSNKPEIAKAIEDLFTVKVQRVTTRITKDGKRAVVRFAEGYSAEDIGMRIGVF